MSAGTLGSSNLDTRLLRFRSRPGEEDAPGLVDDLLEAGRASDAKDVASAALKAKPNDGKLLVADGRARFAAGDLLGAQAALLKAARALPKDKKPFRYLGEVLLKRGDPQRAAKVLQRAQAIDRNDPTIRSLLERASRLERVAESAGSEAPLPPPPARSPAAPAPEDDEPQERTVIRRDLTEQLRSLTQDEDGEDAVTTMAGQAFPDDPPPPAFSQAFEDEPTNLMSGEGLPGLGKPAPPPPSRKPRVKKTMAFGTPAAKPGPPPPRRPAPPVEPDSEESHPTSVERPGRPVRAPGAGTSPGSAKAPAPPPPKRRLPSQQKAKSFDASEMEIDDALGNLEAPGAPAPWAAIDDPFAPPSKPPAKPVFEPRSGPPSEPAAPLEPAHDPFAAGPAPEPTPPAPRVADPFAPTVEDQRSPLAADPIEPPLGDAPVAERFVPPPAQGAEDVDDILRMLRDEGLFEPPGDAKVEWANRAETRKSQGGGTRIGLWMGIVWGLALIAAGAGWFGWQKYIEHRHQQAAVLVEQATEEAYDGDHEHLVDAERHLREARDLNVHDVSGPTLMLFVHSQRALEDGAFDAGFLRPTIAFAEQMESDEIEAYLDMSRAVLAAAEGGHENARTRVASALEARPRDAALLYLAGRLEQRLGSEEALGHLQAAVEGEASLNAPRIALAEARFDAGQADEALELLGQVLANDSEHLRARLWRTYMTSDDEEPEAAIATLTPLDPTVEQHGAPTDRVLYELSRSRLLRRAGNADDAREAVDLAFRAGATEPRLLALVATEGRRAGRLAPAEVAARGAVAGAPSNADFRKLLAEIQLTRRNGRSALTTLAELPADDPDVIEMRAEAALLLGSDEALGAASEGLDAYVEAHPADAEEGAASVRVRALRVRIHVRMGQAREMIAEARQLLADAPGDPDASLALGEAALKIFDAESAVEALEQATGASPDSIDAHYLLGRARRMGGDGEGAEQALRRAVALSPDYIDAKVTLGSLLLDLGNYEGANEIYSGLARSALSASGSRSAIAGRLGRAEALIGLGRLDDADTQIEGLAEGARETPSGRMTTARLRLAQGRAGDALRVIRPLANNDEGATATILALYGDALLAARQVGPAGDAYTAALESDSGSPEALVGQADMAVRSERPSDAGEALDRLDRVLQLRIRPPALRARALTLRGRALIQAGRDSDGAARIREAIELGAAPPEAHFYLGEALSGDNSPDARASYERYLELAPEGPLASRARRAIR